MANDLITVRPATERDLETLIEGNARLAQETEDRALDEELLSQGVRAALAHGEKGRYFLAEREGSLAGQLMLTREWSDWRNGHFWWIQSVYVWPAHRRCGVFRALYEHVQSEARATPAVCGLRLYVEVENAAARQTYVDLGMERCDYEMLEVDFRRTEPGPHRP